MAAHSFLFWLYGKRLGRGEDAVHHARMLHACHTHRKNKTLSKRRIRQEAAQRAEQRKEKREAENRKLMAAITNDALFEIDSEKAPAALPRKPGAPAKEFIIVTGLPRSGTSLMMQMLAAGGLPVMTDGKRKADDDNPRGYFEWEAIKRLKQSPQLLDKAEGMACKVVTLYLGDLPRHHTYKAIFMRRPANEIAASQRRMIKRRNGRQVVDDLSWLARLIDDHQKTIIETIAKAPRAE